VSIRIVRLGTARSPDEGVRLGTVRRPPRGVPKSRYTSDNWFDVWLPNLAPSDALIRSFRQSAADGAWRVFAARYRREMARPEASHLLDALAALSRDADFSVGCYCEDERRCHRSLLRDILAKHGAKLAVDRSPPTRRASE
jgi:uncharacterized protein YeaO (DUF488 family)